MSISIYHKRQKSGPPLTYIREVYRDPVTRKPTSRILESFGKVLDDPEAMKKVQSRLEHYRKSPTLYGSSVIQKLNSLDEILPLEGADKAHSIGFAPYLKLWDRLGLGKYFKTVTRDSHVPYTAMCPTTSTNAWPSCAARESLDQPPR